VTENSALVMMKKVGRVIIDKAVELGLDLESVTAQVPMKFPWPWELLWNTFENEINKARVQSSKQVIEIEKMKGHISQTKATKDSNWERGTAFASPAVQSFARQAVMAKVEKRSEKNTC